MKCHYCQQECEPVPDAEYFTLRKEECKKHQFLVRAIYNKKDPSNIHWTFYPFLNGRKYRVLIEMVGEKLSCTISCVVTYTDLSPSSKRKDIVSFDFDPGITPENALQKLPIILTFI